MSEAINVSDFVQQVVEEGLYCTECPLYHEDCKTTCNQFKELKCQPEHSTSSQESIPQELL